MIQVGVYETRPYDRDSLSRMGEGKGGENILRCARGESFLDGTQL